MTGRRYDSAGIPAGGEFPVSGTSYSAVEPRIVADASGNFLVTWTSLDGDDADIRARFYDTAGSPAGDEFQMAVFLLKALEGSSYDPPDCTGVFDDVDCTPGTGFSDWIEELYTRTITGGCSVTPPLHCPTNPNNRGQMAVFLVKTFGLVLNGG